MLLKSLVGSGVVESTNENFPPGLGQAALAIPRGGKVWSLKHFFLFSYSEICGILGLGKPTPEGVLVPVSSQKPNRK